MVVKFYFDDVSVKLKERKRLKQFIGNLFVCEGKQFAALTYVFCSDRKLIAINKEFLHHDTYTDIITFCFSGLNEPIAGEIYISSERVRDNAKQLGINMDHELHRVIFHGALHLSGYRDKTREEKRIMRSAENKYLGRYFNEPVEFFK